MGNGLLLKGEYNTMYHLVPIYTIYTSNSYKISIGICSVFFLFCILYFPSFLISYLYVYKKKTNQIVNKFITDMKENKIIPLLVYTATKFHQ